MAVGSSNDFDLIVLGAGTGGYTAAFRGAQLGLRVALVDEGLLGGTCLHRGCIPTKAMLESAALNERLRHAADYGLKLPGAAEIDFPQIAKRRDQIVTRMWKGVTSLVKKNDVTWIAGRGRLDGAHKVRVKLAGEDGTPGAGGERILNGTDVILATGSRVKSLPGIVPDGKRIVTSDDILKSESMPASVIVIGAGAVGVEFASMYHDLGAEVTLLEYLPGDRAARGPRGQQGAGAQLLAPRPQGRHERPVRRGQRQGRRHRGLDHRRPRRQGPRGGAGGAPARGRRPGDQRRGPRPRDHVGRGGPGHRQGRRAPAHARAPPVRDRRHRRRADARPHGGPRGDHRGPHDRRRPRRARDGLRAAAAGDLLPPGDRLDRAHRAGVRGAGPPDQDLEGARSRPSPRRSSAASTRGSPRSSRTRTRTTRSAST